MHIVGVLKQVVGWGDDSAKTDHREKLALLVSALGLTALTAAKEFVDRSNGANVDSFIRNATTFYEQCLCIDNGCEKLQCANTFPTFPQAASGTPTNILTAASVFCEIAILLLMIRGGIRAYSTEHQGPADDGVSGDRSSYRPLSFERIDENSHLSDPGT